MDCLIIPVKDKVSSTEKRIAQDLLVTGTRDFQSQEANTGDVGVDDKVRVGDRDDLAREVVVDTAGLAPQGTAHDVYAIHISRSTENGTYGIGNGLVEESKSGPTVEENVIVGADVDGGGRTGRDGDAQATEGDCQAGQAIK
jgi:hypothetical protein